MAAEPRAQRWARIRAERREQILAGASEVFARHGVDKSSMGLVAAACEATKVTVYAHFRSKDVLAAAVLQRWLAEVEHALGTVGSDADHLPYRLGSIADGLQQVVGSHAYRALSRAVQHPDTVPAAVLARWERRFDRQRGQLRRAFSVAGTTDAGQHAEALLALLDQVAAPYTASAVVSLFLAAYRTAP